MDKVEIKKPRLEWLDAPRGFTMMLVVAYHVAIGMMLALRAVNHKQIQALLKLMNGTPLDYQQAVNSVRDILKAD